MNKTISIALATYNGATFLEALLDSLAQQNYLPMELVVSDDNSSDNTLDILEKFSLRAPFKVNIIKNVQQLGVINNFAKAFENAQGDLIAYCDQDDIWHPEKLARCVSYFSRPETKLVMHRSEVVNDALKPLGYCIPEAGEIEIGETAFPSSPDMTYGLGHQMLFDRKMYQDFSWLFSGNFPALQEMTDNYDLRMPFIAGMNGSIFSLDDIFVQFRRHQTATSDAGLGDKKTEAVSGFLGKDKDEYYHQARRLYAIAICLDENIIPNMPAYETTLNKYCVFLKERSKLLETRGKIYQSGSIIKRFYHYLHLYRNKAYRPKQHAGFGRKAFFVDGFVSALGLRLAKRLIALKG